jgi:hypothetical protein
MVKKFYKVKTEAEMLELDDQDKVLQLMEKEDLSESDFFKAMKWDPIPAEIMSEIRLPKAE